MTQTIDTASPAYHAALAGVAIADENDRGRIFMRGRDRAALLQRLSTADMLRLKPGGGTRTVLTTPIGRIIDLLTVHALDDALLVVTSAGQGGAVWSHLKKNIFFQDQVTLEAGGRSHAQLVVYGPQAAEALSVDAALPLGFTMSVELAGRQVLAAAREPIGGPSFTLYIPVEHLDAVQTMLLEAGAQVIDAATLDVLRVEQGYAAPGRELSQEYIPLETGLNDAISFTKGCYVGQEIIARMESRGRLAKTLRGLRIEIGEEGLGESANLQSLISNLQVPTKLDVDGKEAGDLTSVVVSPRFGPIALAYVRTAHAEPGTMVGIAGSDLRGEVVELPFGDA